MTSHHDYAVAVAELGLPAEWQTTIVLRPRRRTLCVQVKPGGTVAILVPPSATPQRLAQFVSDHRKWITDKASTAVRRAPAHPVKTFIDGTEFELLGQRYRLELLGPGVPPPNGQPLPTVLTNGVLYARREAPERIQQAIIGLYQQTGLAWILRQGRRYELDARIQGLRYGVRDLGRRRWGIYDPRTHVVTLHWTVFGLPMHLIDYVLVHELSHAARPGGRAHGPSWQRRMHQWMPGWRQLQSELADAGRQVWIGDWTDPA
ncbi:DUF45 domain-containing protein [Crossiella sp. CA-258035]|uniref:M48 family metallopeptidase n=1 Tax=Crossiella sp. CA-258035 TaxID=2981138 RepID=UPI0024BC8812|nr:YgjP-like metallopeptidase domain-containing protein [Crossiella sp. CA-258035]WHT20201.1 DUF45 domain-containing protein [Crossiella sp. CA-258035]